MDSPYLIGAGGQNQPRFEILSLMAIDSRRISAVVFEKWMAIETEITAIRTGNHLPGKLYYCWAFADSTPKMA
jgi:hypothetical protein